MEIIKIKEFVDKAFKIETELIAAKENPVLFALYQIVTGYIYQKYEIESTLTENLDIISREIFFKRKIVEQLDTRINQLNNTSSANN